MPFVNHDTTQLAETERFLKSGFISVDIFAVSPIDEKSEGTKMVRRVGDAPQAMSTFAVGEEAEQQQQLTFRDVGEVAAPLDRTQPKLMPGSTARVDVVVRTRRIGHFFPGGTVDAFDIWLELEGRDANGKLVLDAARDASPGGELAIAELSRLVGLGPEAALQVGLVIGVVALEPDHLRVALERLDTEDVAHPELRVPDALTRPDGHAG